MYYIIKPKEELKMEILRVENLNKIYGKGENEVRAYIDSLLEEE